MNHFDVEKKLIELRMAEMEARDQVVEYLKEIHERKLWKDFGYKSLADFCRRELGYDTAETREILVRMGIILPSTAMKSSDPKTQARIDALRTWRSRKASLHAIAAYRILNNRTLLKVAEANPRSLDDLAKIPGIGPRKLAELGEELLKLLAQLLE